MYDETSFFDYTTTKMGYFYAASFGLMLYIYFFANVFFINVHGVFQLLSIVTLIIYGVLGLYFARRYIGDKRFPIGYVAAICTAIMTTIAGLQLSHEMLLWQILFFVPLIPLALLIVMAICSDETRSRYWFQKVYIGVAWLIFLHWFVAMIPGRRGGTNLYERFFGVEMGEFLQWYCGALIISIGSLQVLLMAIRGRRKLLLKSLEH